MLLFSKPLGNLSVCQNTYMCWLACCTTLFVLSEFRGLMYRRGKLWPWKVYKGASLTFYSGTCRLLLIWETLDVIDIENWRNISLSWYIFVFTICLSTLMCHYITTSCVYQSTFCHQKTIQNWMVVILTTTTGSPPFVRARVIQGELAQ